MENTENAKKPRAIEVTGVIGKSQAIQEILTMTDRVAATSATVLIQGESGTGKELIAKRLHQKSERSSGPFVTVNCGALQESLLESELFGHERGAFTGAVTQKIGLAEVASGGTLFLDEVGELAPGIQAKLLRFLQEGEFYRVGGKQPLKVDVRIISATNRDLQKEVHGGRFREDLFYRLNTISIKVPALRAHAEDVPELVDHFLKSSKTGQATHQVEQGVYDALRAYPWPGNIRELQNTIERMKILSDGPVIRISDLPPEIGQPRSARPDVGTWNAGTPLDDVERDHILRSLSHFDGNKTRTAQSLKITIKTLYNKLHRYGVLTPSKLGENSYVQAETQVEASLQSGSQADS